MDPGLCGYGESLNVLGTEIQTDFYEDREVTIAFYVGTKDDSMSDYISDMTVKQKTRHTHNPPQVVSLSLSLSLLRIFLCVRLMWLFLLLLLLFILYF